MHSISKFKRVIVINRGEIAIRVFRALRELNIESVAVYSDADVESSHIKFADYAYHLPGQLATESYLDFDKIIKAICETQSDAVHPGYGFLSENVEFLKQLQSRTSAKFIGPSVSSMELLGAKISSKKFMKKNSIPIVPGLDEAITNFSDLVDFVHSISFPVILKASHGGGGKGMRVVHKLEDLRSAYDACLREAQSYFASSDVFCEKYLENPRHIEVQILGDNYGNAIHLFERECSIQRKHQKIIEEAPSSFLSHEKRETLGELSRKIAKLIHYEGAGTIEYITSDGKQFFFMEMNTRIQVEHPVTEMITGVDLVKQQINIAQGYPLDIEQKSIKIRGHSLEARITAEDPNQNFLPSSGKISYLNMPYHPFIRIDSHIYRNYEVPVFFDSLLAKVISWGESRDVSIRRLILALMEFSISGITTNKDFLISILEHNLFKKGQYDTHFIQKQESMLLGETINQNNLSQIDSHAIASLASIFSLEKKDANKTSCFLEKGKWFHHRRDFN